MRRQRAVSVGRRLAVGVQVATAAVLLGVAFAGYGRLASDLAFMHRYVLARIEGISDAMEHAAQLKLAAEAAPKTSPNLSLMKRWTRDVRLFLDRYRTEWAVAENRSEDALHFRAVLERSNRGGLAAEETAAMNDVGSSLQRIETRFASDGSGSQVTARIEDDARPLSVGAHKRIGVWPSSVSWASKLRANRERVRLVLLDYFMPGIDPACCARELRSLASSTVIVLCTAAVDPAARAAEVGLSRWLAKPFDVDVLETLVREAARPPHDAPSATSDAAPRGW